MGQSLSITGQKQRYLQLFVYRGKASARTLTRARVLLKVAEGWKDQEIIAAFDVFQATATNVYERYAESGLEDVLHGKVQ